jgi:hypothetical protein
VEECVYRIFELAVLRRLDLSLYCCCFLFFSRLLRVDGKFEGKLLSKGDIIVGNTGDKSAKQRML